MRLVGNIVALKAVSAYIQPNLYFNVTQALAPHRCSLLSEPLWISLIFTVHIHLLRSEGHAAVTMEVEAVVSTDVGSLLLQLSILRLQKLRQTWFGSLGPTEEGN